jgi:glyoxylase-like metal-dependent hydrolase (beta-lactamase superfamily II)
MSLRVYVIPVTPLQQNCSLIVCTATNKAAFVDPGGDVAMLMDALRQSGAELEKILLTHGHMDHAGGASEIRELTGKPIEGPHEDERFLLESLSSQGARFGMHDARDCEPDHFFKDGDKAQLGEVQFDVVHCPGHTPGHVVYVQPDIRVAFVGDVLFRGSVGRTDFPRGDHAALVHSIREKLFPMGDDIQFVSGHGENSTFGMERRANPFVSDMAVRQS